MKLTGLTFKEAAQALNDGKCAGIKPDGDEGHLVKGASGQGLVWHSDCPIGREELFLPIDYVLGTWSLVSPVRRKLTGFLNIYEDTALFHLLREDADKQAEDTRITCVPFEFELPFPGEKGYTHVRL